MTYRITTAGRMAVLAQLIAVMLLFGFASWLLATTLGITLADPIASFKAAQPTWTSGQRVPAFFIVIVMIATPLLMWQLLGELLMRYTITPEGLSIATLGIHTTVPWATIRGFRTAQPSGLTERIDLLLTEPVAGGIGPWLHTIRRSLPIYAAVQDRETLLATIRERVSQPTAQS